MNIRAHELVGRQETSSAELKQRLACTWQVAHGSTGRAWRLGHCAGGLLGDLFGLPTGLPGGLLSRSRLGTLRTLVLAVRTLSHTLLLRATALLELIASRPRGRCSATRGRPRRRFLPLSRRFLRWASCS